MTSKDIDSKLREKFQSHKYELSNSFVYNWESDFFSITTTGYSQEIEIKVSLSDFRADFKKVDKHQLLLSKSKDKKFMLFRQYDTYEVEYQHPESVIENGRRVYDEVNSCWKKIAGEKVIKRTMQTDRIESVLSGFLNVKYTKTACGIHIKELGSCPNKFWYCCPEGVIPVNEVPEYAGLYYLSENMRMKVIKKAPFIHKEKQDLTSVLLEKFYWLSVNIQRALKFNETQQITRNE